MIYTIKTQRGILTFLFALNSASLLFESEGASQYIFYLQCAIQIVILIGLIIKYELDFAHKHEVPILKTRDFVILEK